MKTEKLNPNYCTCNYIGTVRIPCKECAEIESAKTVWTRNYTINEILHHTGNKSYNSETDQFDKLLYNLASLKLCANHELSEIYSEMAGEFSLKVIN